MEEASRFSISPLALYAALGTAQAPSLIDVRPSPIFDHGDVMIVSALRRAPEATESWVQTLPRERRIVVYCDDGGEISAALATTLRKAGCEALALAGGLKAWAAAGLPFRRREPPSALWVTRERPKVDRIACPWLIRRFIDPEAKFLYVPSAEVRDTAARTGAIPYDVAGAEFGHRGEQCSFDAFLHLYGIRDTILDRLAAIVRGADTGRPEMTPQSPGLLAVSHGLSANFDDDHAMLEQGMFVYDALFAWCRQQDSITADQS